MATERVTGGRSAPGSPVEPGARSAPFLSHTIPWWRAGREVEATVRVAA